MESTEESTDGVRSKLSAVAANRLWTNRMIIFISIVLFILITYIGGGTYIIYLNINIINNLQEDISQLSNTVQDLRMDVSNLEDVVHSQDNILNRLMNHTNNADVIDKLEEYKHLLYSKTEYIDSALDSNILRVNDILKDNSYRISSMMSNISTGVGMAIQSSYSIINSTIEDVKINVNGTVAATIAQMADVRSHVSAQLAFARSNISLALEDTRNNVTQLIDSALVKVNGVQDNVSSQLELMQRYVNSSVVKISAVMEDATTTIHQEVLTVKDSVEEYVSITNEQFAKENDFVKYQLAGTFTLLACLISLWHITSHQRHLNKPDIQRRVMAVLWMVPIYSITSWLSLVFPKTEYYLSTVRDCYEAYAVYTFIALLIAIIEDGKGLSGLLSVITHHVISERNAIAEARLKGLPIPQQHIIPPFNCCIESSRADKVAAAWLYQCKLMAMQFVMLKPLLSAIPFLCLQLGWDISEPSIILDGAINLKAPKLYLALCKNLSVAAAFYGLLSFYHGTEKDLAWCNPWPKFLCIKGVVFATFWQGAGIQAMNSLGAINERGALQIQCLLICIEMLLASIAHFYVFPYNEWQENYKREKEKGILLRDTLALRDFVTDFRQMVTTWDTSGSAGHASSSVGHVRNMSSAESSPQREVMSSAMNVATMSLSVLCEEEGRLVDDVKHSREHIYSAENSVDESSSLLRKSSYQEGVSGKKAFYSSI